MPLHVSSTCAYHQEVKIVLHSLLYHYTYRCDDTRGCVMQFWPHDDEHMCSKHVETRNKLIVKQKFCASSSLITEINTQLSVGGSEGVLLFLNFWTPGALRRLRWMRDVRMQKGIPVGGRGGVFSSRPSRTNCPVPHHHPKSTFLQYAHIQIAVSRIPNCVNCARFGIIYIYIYCI